VGGSLRAAGVVPLAGGSTGVQMAGWFNREIRSLDDLRGLRMRIPGLAGEVFSAAGGEAVRIPGGEVYTALQTGVIDAVEWVGPYNDLALGLHEIAEYYYYPGWHEPGSMLEFIVNAEALASLPRGSAGHRAPRLARGQPGHARRVHGAQQPRPARDGRGTT
jgi:TRAP-type mannitol/chloroaromatic compound transport system substrate-binding protein